MYFGLTTILLFCQWIIMSGKFDSFHLTLGALSSALIAGLTHDLLFKDRNKTFTGRVLEAGRFAQYCLWLLYQIVLANIHVIALALSHKHFEKELDPHIFTFRTHLKTNFARFVLANSITLTPGTVTVRIEGDTFYVHAISKKAAGDLVADKSANDMELRIARVFEHG